MEDCAICYELLDPKISKIQKINCSHIFHERCIDRYFNSNLNANRCPVCRQKMTSSELDVINVIEHIIHIEMLNYYGTNSLKDRDYKNVIDRFYNNCLLDNEMSEYITEFSALLKNRNDKTNTTSSYISKKELPSELIEKRNMIINYVLRIVCDDDPSGKRSKRFRKNLENALNEAADCGFDSEEIDQW